MTCERIGLHEILQEYMEIFSRYIDRYLNITGGLSRLRKLYLAQMWRKDIPARYIDYTNLPAGHLDTPVPITLDTDSSSGFTGIIRDLSPNGSLLVEDLSVTPSRIREFSFKEIGYIIKF